MVGQRPEDAVRRNEGGLLQDASAPVNPRQDDDMQSVH
jgi:hypothetical protein